MDSNEMGKVDQLFDEWFWQAEGFHLYAERFYEEFEHEMDAQRATAWIKAAFEAGYHIGQEQRLAKEQNNYEPPK